MCLLKCFGGTYGGKGKKKEKKKKKKKGIIMAFFRHGLNIPSSSNG